MKYLGTVRLACVSIFLFLLWDSDYIGVTVSMWGWPDFDINWGLHQHFTNFNFLQMVHGEHYFQGLEEITSFWYISTYDSSLAPCHNWLLHWVQGYTANLYCPLQKSLVPGATLGPRKRQESPSLYNFMPIMAEICRYLICGRYRVIQLCSGFLYHNVKE